VESPLRRIEALHRETVFTIASYSFYAESDSGNNLYQWKSLFILSLFLDMWPTKSKSYYYLLSIFILAHYSPNIVKTCVPAFLSDGYNATGMFIQEKWEYILDNTTDDYNTLYPIGKWISRSWSQKCIVGLGFETYQVLVLVSKIYRRSRC